MDIESTFECTVFYIEGGLARRRHFHKVRKIRLAPSNNYDSMLYHIFIEGEACPYHFYVEEIQTITEAYAMKHSASLVVMLDRPRQQLPERMNKPFSETPKEKRQEKYVPKRALPGWNT